MGTATVGGLFYNIGMAITQCVNKALPDVNITAEVTQGSTENLRLIAQKKMQLAVITPMIGNYAQTGVKMFKGKPVDFRAVVRLLPNANVWAVLKKSKVKRFSELKGKKVGVGPASGGLGVVARSHLAVNGINYKEDINPYFLGAGAMAKLDKLDTARADLKADNLHELMRVHEAMNIQQVAKITATAALARKETRFPPYHYRADFTETDDENYCGLIVVKKSPDGEVTTRFEPLSYEL